MEFLETTDADYKEEQCRLKDKQQHNKTQDAVFNPKALLHGKVFPAEVQQMVLIKEEALEVQILGMEQQDPETLNIKEEEEELWTSQEGEQFCVKKESDDTGFAFTAVPLKSEKDEEKPLVLQLHQHQLKEEELPSSSSADQIKAATGGEDCGGAETTRNPDLNTYGDDCSSSETEVSEDDEGDDVNDSDFQLSDSGSESEESDKDWKEGRAPESGVNTVNKSCSFTEHEKPFHKTSQSVMSSNCLAIKESFEVKKTGGSIKKKQSRQNSFSFLSTGVLEPPQVMQGVISLDPSSAGHRSRSSMLLTRGLGFGSRPCVLCGLRSLLVTMEDHTSC
ncbi:uncharacterized protein LOC119421155 [Nematolebias whitei]|uniref:uncharacterized protein LOC119421155 n=1 Tax=Nematolebias whitei TaxID=451745 RepID=UPI00189ADDB3|nr:uncharacterized protein LOC119421155 [Nematolebias whitei]